MLIKLSKHPVLFLLLSTFLLCHCSKAVNVPEPVVVVKKKIVSPYTKPTTEYLALAKNKEGLEKHALLISAAGRMISEGQWRQGATILAQTDDLTDGQANEKNILLADIALSRDKPQDALAKLSSISDETKLTPYYQIQFHELLAQAYRNLKRPIESISERIKLEPLLADENSEINNRRLLWLTLINLPEAELDSTITEMDNKSELHGWLELVLISRKYRDNSKSLLAALEQWQSHYPNHPANNMLPNPLDSIAHKMVAKPSKIALLLPLSGALSGPGQAIREGFMAAYKANKAEQEPEIKAYDTNKGLIEETYQQAIQDGADYVVGPLTKSQVAVVAALNHPVPTLLLNDSDASVQDNSYLFGLSPANEATQVALKAKSKGYHRALIIAPKNDWGNEVTKAFTRQWKEKNGQIADIFLYAAGDDLNKKMRDLLQITNSESREKQLKQVLGYTFQSSASRRQDFDMIFLLAYPSKARQIMPLLKYYYAGDVPVFATSSVYGGSANALKDKDLDGVVFCDIPWVFSHQMGTRNWPEQFNSYNRLYALGMDSYALTTQLNQLILFPADGTIETNGTLYLKPTQQVARILEWGQFRQGLVHSLSDTV